MNDITNYLENVLYKFLSDYNLPSTVIDQISEDIHIRICSLLQIWKDENKRKAILTIGLEEASFYEPKDTPLEKRALVVMTIRNSEIENLLSTDEAAAKYGLTKSPIPDSDIRILTSKSIAYFQSIDFDELSKNINDYFVDENIYDVLFDKYPLVTRALEKLGNWSNKGMNFNKFIVSENTLDEMIDFNYYHDKFANENGIIVDSGMNPIFSKELLNQLEKITAEELPVFYSDSFKSLTRHTEKLLKVIEFVLRHNGVFVTANFYISNGYVSKRKDLLKPMHTNKDFISNLKNLHGLNKPHFNLLKSIRNQLN